MLHVVCSFFATAARVTVVETDPMMLGNNVTTAKIQSSRRNASSEFVIFSILFLFGREGRSAQSIVLSIFGHKELSMLLSVFLIVLIGQYASMRLLLGRCESLECRKIFQYQSRQRISSAYQK